LAVSDPERLTRKIRAALAPCSLGRWPTPLEPAPALARTIGLDALWLKREDRSAPRCGGNKVRGLELLLAGVPAGSVFVTVGGTGSTHYLATAVHAAALSCRATLAQFPQPETEASRAVAAACDAHAALVVRAPTRLAHRAARLLADHVIRVPDPAARTPLVIADGRGGKGYGHPTPEGDSARRLAAEHGLVLDSTYGAKAFAVLLQRGTWNVQRVVF